MRLALWAALLIATEATVPHVTAGTHKETLIAQLAGLLVIRSGVVPARSSAEPAQEREPAASRTRKQ